MAIDGAVRLNRAGLERGKLLPAILLLIAVFAPMIVWHEWDDMVSGEEELPPGSVVTLTAVPPPMAPGSTGSVSLTVYREGWTTDIGSATAAHRTLVHYPIQLSLTAVSGVERLDVLFERQQRDLADDSGALFTTSARPYHTRGGLEGLWGDLTGENYSGALVVVGRGSAAAVVVVTAPLGRLDREMDDLTDMMSTLEVTS